MTTENITDKIMSCWIWSGVDAWHLGLESCREGEQSGESLCLIQQWTSNKCASEQAISVGSGREELMLSCAGQQHNFEWWDTMQIIKMPHPHFLHVRRTHTYTHAHRFSFPSLHREPTCSAPCENVIICIFVKFQYNYFLKEQIVGPFCSKAPKHCGAAEVAEVVVTPLVLGPLRVIQAGCVLNYVTLLQ